MAIPPTPLGDVFSRYRLTDTIQRALRTEFPFDNGPRFIGLARFLLAVSFPGSENVSNSRKLTRTLLGGPNAQRGLTRVAKQEQEKNSFTEPMISVVLVGVFEQARHIRVRTANDEYFGLRHVLFEIATSADLRLQKARIQIDRAVGEPVFQFERFVAEFCIKHASKTENLHSWIDIIRERCPDIDPRKWLRAANADSTSNSPAPIRVATCTPDDPWSHAQQDRAGSEREARAFAQMICARRFAPPLAVGVFGDWGSGKSFFLRQLYDQIDEYACGSEKYSPDTSGDFHTRVAQIRFNAWHYVETNLWASLVDHIFTCLDRRTERKRGSDVAEQLFDQLDTARRLIVESAQELVRTRRERALAFDALAQAKGALAQARDEARLSAATIAGAAWSELASGETKQALDEAYQRLGLGEAVASADELHKAVTELANAAHERQIAHGARWRWLGRGTTVAAFAALTLLTPLGLEWLAQQAGITLAPVTAAVASIAATASGAFALANGVVRSAANRLRAFGKQLDASIAQKTAAQQAAEMIAQARVDKAFVAEAEAERCLHAVSERAAAATRDFHAHNSRGQVLRFVRERVAQGDYARQLGFTATVRRDFEELSRLMAVDNAPSTSETSDADSARAAHAARVDALLSDAGELLDAKEIERLTATTQPPPEVERVVERIVLYIDDLDRCPPAQVVAVLQAIHLLLAFPLFVVFVAVDVRWLRDALVQQYAWRMNEASGDRTSPAGYLEKIFQIPYWVRPVEGDGIRGILRDRFGAAHDDENDAVDDAPSTVSRNTDTQTRTIAPPVPKPADAAPEPARTPRRVASLRLLQEELALIDRIADVLGGSPRRMLRFVNVYKLIKASLDDAQANAFAQGGYVAATVCLAVSIALPERYARFADAVLTLADDGEPYAHLADALAELREPRFRILETVLEAGANNVRQLHRYATLVERYSFQPRVLATTAVTA